MLFLMADIQSSSLQSSRFAMRTYIYQRPTRKPRRIRHFFVILPGPSDACLKQKTPPSFCAPVRRTHQCVLELYILYYYA